MRGRRNDLTGRVFGNLTVLAHSMRNAKRDKMWLCECTCGARAWKTADNLLRGRVKSCSFEHRRNNDGPT